MSQLPKFPLIVDLLFLTYLGMDLWRIYFIFLAKKEDVSEK